MLISINQVQYSVAVLPWSEHLLRYTSFLTPKCTLSFNCKLNHLIWLHLQDLDLKNTLFLLHCRINPQKTPLPSLYDFYEFYCQKWVSCVKKFPVWKICWIQPWSLLPEITLSFSCLRFPTWDNIPSINLALLYMEKKKDSRCIKGNQTDKTMSKPWVTTQRTVLKEPKNILWAPFRNTVLLTPKMQTYSSWYFPATHRMTTKMLWTSSAIQHDIKLQPSVIRVNLYLNADRPLEQNMWLSGHTFTSHTWLLPCVGLLLPPTLGKQNATAHPPITYVDWESLKG